MINHGPKFPSLGPNFVKFIASWPIWAITRQTCSLGVIEFRVSCALKFTLAQFQLRYSLMAYSLMGAAVRNWPLITQCIISSPPPPPPPPLLCFSTSRSGRVEWEVRPKKLFNPTYGQLSYTLVIYTMYKYTGYIPQSVSGRPDPWPSALQIQPVAPSLTTDALQFISFQCS